MSTAKTLGITATNADPIVEPLMLTPEEAFAQLRAIRDRMPEFVQLPKGRATNQLRRRARINPDFVREAYSSVGASAVVQEAIGNTPEELQLTDAELARWTVVESEADALLRGVVASNVVRRQRIARVAVQAYNVSRELVKEEAHSHLLPYVERMKRLPKYSVRRRAAAPPAAPQTGAVK
ncbi:MAG TPA: hypothetical protein VEK57_23715 [Thermoanaerobaculia bacterium]|nr:hypothetical protein [Thermoanaerobaculia bacterium]